jgi:hypothetical protein
MSSEPPKLRWVMFSSRLVGLWLAENGRPPLVVVDAAWIAGYLDEHVGGRTS